MAAAFGVLYMARNNNGIERTFPARLTLADVREDIVVSRYRLGSAEILELLALISEDVSPQTNRGHSISAETKLLLTLRFLGKGDFYSEVGDLHGVSRSSMSRHLHEVVAAINNKMKNIRFPTTLEERREASLGFYTLCGIPRVLGAVDGTLVPIIAPHDNEKVYVYRKGYHALNIQAVVNSNMRFNDVVARWPGSANDAGIFDNCGLKRHLELNDVGMLLGDSGYPLRHYLMTPVLRPQGIQQTAYNVAHARGRVVVERAFGLLKSRFRCLHKTGGCLMFSPDKCAQIVTACIHLHNLCLDRHVPMPGTVLRQDGQDLDQQPLAVPAPNHSGVLHRNILINRY
ncbi:putative nuclease HARBI1 [Mya arenaria]|uniref:putative nuclease HARBI1 n=1 Tax=Mya arenaria TaxID=6604 RepID=UPI0022E32756|nr:putative nuclease HARBI1 [Mya arenaria]